MAKNKKYALVNSYYKRKSPNMPDTLLEIAKHLQEHGELPFEYSGDNWPYDALIEKQKRNGVVGQQFLTPNKTAINIAEIARGYYGGGEPVLDACCGTGQLSRAMITLGLPVEGFDFDQHMVDVCNIVHNTGGDHNFFHLNFKEEDLPEPRRLIVANPPYDSKDLQIFFEWLERNLHPSGTAVLLIPKDFINKDRPKALKEAIKRFTVKSQEDMAEAFVHTAVRGEILVIKKVDQIEVNEPSGLKKGISDLLGKPDKGIGAAINTQAEVFVKGRKLKDQKGETKPNQVEEMPKDQKYAIVPTANILDNPNNPRKHYNQEELQELADSIKGVGLVQPPTVRPVPVSQIDAKEVFYEVVAGNRRIKASKLAGLEQIPVIIKHLTDEQALEISLIENLQRSDVHPMEEAAAFKQLLDNNKYTVHDVAARFGKSETFVRQRIRLNLLSEKGQELFYDNKLTLTQAVMLAQFNEDTQADIIEAGENSYNGFTKQTFNNFKGILNEASFPLDTNNIAKQGPCTTCQFNTANYQLFSDDSDPRCTNLSCFNKKSDAWFSIKLDAAKEQGAVLVNNHWQNNDFVKALKAKGLTVLREGDECEILEKPELQNKEEFMQDWDEAWSDFETAEQEWKSLVYNFNAELKIYDEAVATGKYVKGFIVDGDGKGDYCYIELNEDLDDSNDAGAKADPNANEIERIKEREKRAKEIDGEKIQKRIGLAVKEIEDVTKLAPDYNLLKSFIRFFIWEFSGWYVQRDLCKIMKVKEADLKAPGRLHDFLDSLTDEQLYIICAKIMKEKYASHTSFNGYGPYFLRKFAEVSGIPVAAFIQEQTEIADKRQERVKQRIAALKPKPVKDEA